MNYDTTKPYKASILGAIRSTWETPYCYVIPHKPYPLVVRKHTAGVEVDHTDGIGTKGVLHWRHRTFRAAVIDALAMNINDLLTVRARPYKLQNHLILQDDDHHAIVEVVTHLAEECRKYGIAVTGGETSIQDNVGGMDLSVTMSGFVEQPAITNSFHTGDTLIGLPSSGIHSNGFTLARKLLTDSHTLTEPTKIYFDTVWPHLGRINGLVHIAGGGFTRLLDMLAPDQTAVIHWTGRPEVFDTLWDKIRNPEIMYSTFNCGVGMVLSVSADDAAELAAVMGGVVIGGVTEGAAPGVLVHSMFSKEMFRLSK